ncbi:MAG TPA: hypothetical protein PLS20_03240 [Ruminococcus flavefaciens]|nr:hypothetical protein [Ruminococcus flavefaciens]
MSLPSKYQALHTFYSSFGVPAYEENSVPETAKPPYITYEVITSEFDGENIALSCQIYDKSNSLKNLNKLTEQLSVRLRGGCKLVCDDGYIMLYRGEPFAKPLPTWDKTVKGRYINISADYITL